MTFDRTQTRTTDDFGRWRGVYLPLIAITVFGCYGTGDSESRDRRDINGYEVIIPCNGCALTVSDPIVLDPSEISGLTRSSKISLQPAGEDVLVAYGPTETPGELRVTTLNGSSPIRTFGRFGNGPDEMERIRTLAFAGPDTIVVLHSSSISVLSLIDSSLSKQGLPPGVSSFELAVSPSRQVFVGNHVPLRRRVIAQAIGEGQVSEFMGSGLSPGSALENLGPTEYHLMTGDDGSLIAIPKQEVWSITKWSADGDSLDGNFIQQPEWFTPFTAAEIDAAREAKDSGALASVTYVTDAQVLGNRYLLVAGRVRDNRPAPGEQAGLAPWNYRNDTVVDVYDLTSNRLVARLQFDAVYTYLAPSGHLIRFLEDADGFVSAILRKIEVTSG
jgi:hypothetical protein